MFVPNAGRVLQGETARNPVKSIFLKCINRLVALVECCLAPVSAECWRRVLINEETYHKTTDAGAQHNSHYILAFTFLVMYALFALYACFICLHILGYVSFICLVCMLYLPSHTWLCMLYLPCMYALFAVTYLVMYAA